MIDAGSACGCGDDRVGIDDEVIRNEPQARYFGLQGMCERASGWKDGSSSMQGR